MFMYLEDSDEDNLLNLYYDYDEFEVLFLEDIIELIKEDIVIVESFILKFYKKLKNKRSGICKENDYFIFFIYQIMVYKVFVYLLCYYIQ